MTSTHSLYLTLQYLRTVNGVHKYHWALYATGSSPPSGLLLHATDANREPLDLYMELRKVSDPTRSKSMVVCLMIGDSPGIDALESAASAVHLMDNRYLPPGESQWTCRVWVKEVLYILEKNRYIKLPYGVDKLEQRCLDMGDAHVQYMGRAKVYNTLNWLFTSSAASRATQIDSSQGYGQHYGSEPMDTETSRYAQDPAGHYYGSKPMITETYGGYYGTKPMVTETSGYYGTKPMVTERYYTSTGY